VDGLKLNDSMVGFWSGEKIEETHRLEQTQTPATLQFKSAALTGA
jgi:hypothetical protein